MPEDHFRLLELQLLFNGCTLRIEVSAFLKRFGSDVLPLVDLSLGAGVSAPLRFQLALLILKLLVKSPDSVGRGLEGPRVLSLAFSCWT